MPPLQFCQLALCQAAPWAWSAHLGSLQLPGLNSSQRPRALLGKGVCHPPSLQAGQPESRIKREWCSPLSWVPRVARVWVASSARGWSFWTAAGSSHWSEVHCGVRRRETLDPGKRNSMPHILLPLAFPHWALLQYQSRVETAGITNIHWASHPRQDPREGAALAGDSDESWPLPLAPVPTRGRPQAWGPGTREFKVQNKQQPSLLPWHRGSLARAHPTALGPGGFHAALGRCWGPLAPCGVGQGEGGSGLHWGTCSERGFGPGAGAWRKERRQRRSGRFLYRKSDYTFQ